MREHPRFQVDFLDRLPTDAVNDADRHEFFFQQASIWPDVARGFVDDQAKFHHPTWHYINIPHYLSEVNREELIDKLTVNTNLVPPDQPIEEMNAIQTIRVARRVLKNHTTRKDDQAIMLAWLFHLVGDIHQPLHSSAIFSPKLFLEGDRGGNRVLTVQGGNLHWLWDSFPGMETTLVGARETAAVLTKDADLLKLGNSAASELDEEKWLSESRNLAVEFVYSPEILGYLRNMEREGNLVLTPIECDEQYMKLGEAHCRRRVVQAGFRLAAVLKEIVR